MLPNLVFLIMQGLRVRGTGNPAASLLLRLLRGRRARRVSAAAARARVYEGCMRMRMCVCACACVCGCAQTTARFIAHALTQVAIAVD